MVVLIAENEDEERLRNWNRAWMINRQLGGVVWTLTFLQGIM